MVFSVFLIAKYHQGDKGNHKENDKDYSSCGKHKIVFLAKLQIKKRL